jgi:hypothetical protein
MPKLFLIKVPLKVQTSSRDISKRKEADLIVKTHSDKNVNYMNSTNLVSTILMSLEPDDNN